MKAYAPNGAQIIGTAELTPGTALTMDDSFERDASGSISYDYAGETKMHWDGQETIERNGKVVLIDENGEEWTEDQIELRNE